MENESQEKDISRLVRGLNGEHLDSCLSNFTIADHYMMSDRVFSSPYKNGLGYTGSLQTPQIYMGKPDLSKKNLNIGQQESYKNEYCANCLRTRRFFERPTHLVCETCQKRLDKRAPKSSTLP